MSESVNISLDTLGDVAGGSNSSLQENCTIVAVYLAPRQVTTTIHVLTLVASLVGNTLLITAFVRMKEPILLLIANMAASDLLVTVFLIPRLITREVTGSNVFLVHGAGGTFLCKICTFLSDMSLSVSTQGLVLIAVERFLAVVYPVRYKNITVKIRRLLVASTWIMAGTFHSPYFYTFRLVASDSGNLQICQPLWGPSFDHKSAHLHYNMFLFITVLLLPLLITSILYTAIVFNLPRDKMAMYRSENGAIRVRKRNCNLRRMTIATISSTLSCWMLFIVISFLKLFSPGAVPKCNSSFKIVDYVSRVLASSYCAVNPCICFVFVRDFTRELGVMCKRKRHQSAIEGRKVGVHSLAGNSCRIEVITESTQAVTVCTSPVGVLVESNV